MYTHNKTMLKLLLAVALCGLCTGRLTADSTTYNVSSTHKARSVEEFILTHLATYAESLYDLDWIEDTPAYQKALSEEERFSVAYKKFLERKSELIKDMAFRIARGKAGHLALGTTAIGAGGYKGYHWVEDWKQHREAARKKKDSEAAKDDNPKKWWTLSSPLDINIGKNQENVNGLVKAWESVAKTLNEGLRLAWEYLGWIPGITLFGGWVGLEGISKNLSEVSPLTLGQRMVSSLSYLFTGKMPMKDPYASIEKEYVKHYFHIKKANEHLLKQLRRKMKEMRNASHNFESCKAYMETAYKLPMRMGKLSFDVKKYEAAYQFYNEKTIDALRRIIAVLCPKDFHDTSPTTSFPFYFHGIPGSGKTYAAMQLARVTQAPLYYVDLEGSTVQDIVGTQHEPGKLVRALTAGLHDAEVNFRNGVLFIDEFDRLINADEQNMETRALVSFMLKMLSSENLKFFSPYFNCYIDLPSVVILTGNHAPKDAALRDRLQIIEFDGYDKETKWKIAEAIIIPNVAQKYGIATLQEEDLDALRDIIGKEATHGGMRDVEKQVANYFVKRKAKQLFAAPAA